MLRFQEIDAKPAKNNEAYNKVCVIARDTKQLNELLQAGHAYLKLK